MRGLNGALRGRRVHDFGAARNANRGDNALGRNIALILQAYAVNRLATDEDLFRTANIGVQNWRLIRSEHAGIAAAGDLQCIAERFFAARCLRQASA